MEIISNRRPCDDKFFMPAEYDAHEGTLMIYPVRPGSWGKDRSGALNSFKKIFIEIIKRESLFLIADEAYLNEAASLIYVAINEYCDELKISGKYGEVFEKYIGHDVDDELILEDILEERCFILKIESDDAWARDVGPTFVVNKNGDRRGINWKFNAWGGDFDGLYASWEKDDALALSFCKAIGIDMYDTNDFVLEGGSIHTDGEGTLIVTESCLLSQGRNPSLSKEQIEDNLKKYLGAIKVLWLPRGIYNDETNEHVDNVCAFVAPCEVVLAWTDDQNNPQYELSKACLDYLEKETDAKGRKLKIHKLPIPEHPVLVSALDLQNYEFEDGEDMREEGERLAASYVNFYFVNGAALVPQFGGENTESDQKALGILQKVCKSREIIGISARDILLGGGNIHCITQQIPYCRN